MRTKTATSCNVIVEHEAENGRDLCILEEAILLGNQCLLKKIYILYDTRLFS